MIEQADLTAAGIAKGSIYLTLQNIFSTMIAVLGFAFMARIITQDEMGMIAGATLLAGLVQLISDFGLNSSIPKHVSESTGRGEDISSFVVSALTLRVPVCLLLGSTVFILASNISILFFKTAIYTSAVRLLSIDGTILSLTPLLNSVLWGAGKLRSMAIYGVASIAVRWLSITALLLTSKGVDGVIIGWIAGDTALLLMQTFRVTRLVGFKKQDFKAFGKSATTLLKFAFPLYIASAVSFLYTWYDKAVILAYLPLSDLGIYNTTYLAFTVLVTIATALGSALLPYYGMAYGRNDHRAISLGIKRAIKYTALVVFPLALGLAATSKTTLAIFAGQQYQAGWTVLTILSLFGLTYGIAPALSNVLLIYGKTKTILLLSLVPVVSSLTLLPLVWVYGLSGLAIMRGISLALSFILTAYFTNKTAKIQIDRPALSRALVASATMAAAILVLQQAFYSSYLVPVYIIVGAIIYVALIRLLRALDQEDFQLLNQVIGKKATKYVMKILGYTHTP